MKKQALTPSANTQRTVVAGMMVTLINPYIIHYFLASSLVRFESDVPG